MPFGDARNWDECVKKRMASGKYTKEVAEKVCGKMKAELEKGKEGYDGKKEYLNSEPSPEKKDTKELSQNLKKANEWEFNPDEILKSSRKVTGTFHVPKIDRDNELITKSAMDAAIPDFMHFPVLHDFHKERVLGVITKVWEEADVYHFDALFKATHDVDDAWNKVQKGEYDHVSIYGSRFSGSDSCRLDPSLRTTPCISHKIRLDSISACDDNARNDHTSMTLVKAGEDLYNSTLIINTNETFIKASGAELEKAMTTSSSMVHSTYDGVGGNKGGKMRVREVTEKEEDGDENSERQAEGAKKTEHPVEKADCPLQKAEEMEKGDDVKGMFKQIIDHLKSLVASDKKVHSEIGKAEKDVKPKGDWEKEEKKEGMESKKVEVAEERTKRFHKEVEKGSMTKINERGTAESAQFAQDSHTSDVKIYNHKTGDFEGPVKKGTRPKVTEEPATKESMSQPVDKRVVEKGGFSQAGRMVTAISSPRASAHSTSTARAEHAEHSTRKEMKKGDTMTEENVIQKAEVSDEQFVEEIVKAHMPNTDEIVKATNAQFDEIKKALTELKGEIEKIKEQPIQKAAVVISEDAPQGTTLNYAAMDEFFKKRA